MKNRAVLRASGLIVWIAPFALLAAAPALAGSAKPTAACLTPDGARLLVVNERADQLMAIDATLGGVVGLVATGLGPSDLAVVPARDEVWVVCRLGTELQRYSLDSLEQLGAIAVPRLCERILVDPVRPRVYVTSSATNELIVINSESLAVSEIVMPGATPRDLAYHADSDRLFVADFHSESVTALEAASLTPIGQVSVGALPRGLTAIGPYVAVGHLGLSGSTADDAIQNRVSLIYASSLSVVCEYELNVATPVDLLAAPDGESLYVAAQGSGKVVKVSRANGAAITSVNVGVSPAALARHPDGRLFAISPLDDTITVIHNDADAATWGIYTGGAGPTAAALRGERLFNAARPPLLNSCASCHPGGGSDNLSRFVAPPNYLNSPTINTPALHSARWTAPYLRIGSVPSIELHAAAIAPKVFGQPLSSDELTDLVSYLRTVGPVPNPFGASEAELSPLEQQGRQLFISKGCASCHAQGLYLDTRLHDVGTGGEAETPSLLGLWASAPYLNDGRAATLEDVFAPVAGRHLPAIASASERSALAAYLLTLPAPRAFWDAPSHWPANGYAVGQIPIQVFDVQTGRPRPGVPVTVEVISGPSGVELQQPGLSNSQGEALATMKATQPGTLKLRLRVDGELVEPVQTVQLFAPGKTLVNVAAAAGAGFVMPAGAYPRAVAIGDFDGDQYPDVFVAVSAKGGFGQHVGSPSVLLRNRGDGTFEDVTVAAGLFRPGKSSAGAAFGDYDNDGDLDLFVNNRGALNAVAISELFRNNGDGTFTEVGAAAGVANPGFGYGVYWYDHDHDGDLDLFCQNQAVGGNEGNTTPSALYRNNGNGTFTNITGTVDAGWAASGGDGGAVGDIDNDGWQDVVQVSIDEPLHRYFVLKNMAGGQLVDQWSSSGLGNEFASRGATLGDLDNDGDLDLFVVGRGIFRNNGPTANPRFTDITPQIGFDFGPYRGRRFGHAMTDINNDGWLDIVAENRHDALAVFINQQNGAKFQVLSGVDVILDTAADPRVGLGALDFDQDGDIDIFLGREGAAGNMPQALFENRIDNGHQFLRVSLVGAPPLAPRGAEGARVYLTDQFGLTQMRELSAGENASGGGDHVLHFGLGAKREATLLRVRWPGGQEQEFSAVAANQHLRITQNVPAAEVLKTWFDAGIEASVLGGPAPLAVEFTAQVLHGTPPYTYLWDFGDGAFATGPVASHVFTNSSGAHASYTVKLIVRDAVDALAEATATIAVGFGLTGDLNNDCSVNDADLGLLLLNFGCQAGGTACVGDLNSSGAVDDSDLGLLLDSYGDQCD